MFKCQLTGKQSLPEEKPVRVVLETREKKYFKIMKNGQERQVGQGWEIVREALVCREAAEKLKG